MSEPLIVSASGIRGVVGSGLGPEVAARYGAAFGTFLSEREEGEEGAGRGYAIVGRDSRTSGPLLTDAVAAGLRAAGRDVRDVEVAPTPTVLLATGDDPAARGAVVVTASHNPVQWNGLKLGGADGLFLSPAEGRRVQALFEAGPELAAWDGLGGRGPLAGIADRHVDRILSLSVLDPEAVAAAGFTVALDCVRGAGGLVLPRLLERLGCRVVGIHLEPDGRFPRNPEPTPENLGELAGLVRESGAELGMAVDPDGDRLSLVDGRGVPVGEDWTLALAVELVLGSRRGTVVTNLSSSSSVRDAAERNGGRLLRAPVGEANVARRMAEADAVIGGEGNGGVMLPELHATRDAPLAAALVLQLLAREGTALADLLARWPRYHIAKRKAALPEEGLESTYAALVTAAAEAPASDGREPVEVDRQDGLRVEWEGGRWLHVRPSGTEPIVRLVAEAADADEAERLLAWAESYLPGPEGRD